MLAFAGVTTAAHLMIAMFATNTALSSCQQRTAGSKPSPLVCHHCCKAQCHPFLKAVSVAASKPVSTGWSPLRFAQLIILLPQSPAAIAQRCGVAMCRAVCRGWSHQGRRPTRPWPTAASWTWPRLASTSLQPPALMRSRLDSESLASDAACVCLLHA